MKPRIKPPWGLRGQLIVVLLSALVLAQLASVGLFLDERHRVVQIATAKESASRILTMARELEAAPAGIHATVLRAGESRDLRFSIDGNALTHRADSQALDHLTRRVARIVHAPDERALGIALGKPDPAGNGPSRDRHEDWDDDPYELVLSVALADGTWLNARVDIGRPPLQWAWPTLASIVFMAVVIVAAVWLMVGRISGPMRALAKAAHELGLDDSHDPLPLAGPVEVRDTTAAFNAMADRLTRLIAERTQMLAAIGHDLRSPITAMRIRIEMIDDDETRERLLICLEEIHTLVEAALALAKGTTTGEPTVPVDLAALLEDVAAVLVESGAPATLTVETPVTVAGRPAALRRALRNVAENAARYGEEARIVLRRDARLARIEIEDDGPGIPAADRERVFDAFVRLEDSRSRETGGAGLGLAIARTVIEAHGGRIVFEESAAGGARAVITLPLE